MPQQRLWFRLYSEFADDPKVQILPEEMQRRLVMLFCMRSAGIDLCTLKDQEIALKLRISTDDLRETKAVFMRQGFIDSRWDLVHWNKRQFVNDAHAKRQREYRRRKKEEARAAADASVTVEGVTQTSPPSHPRHQSDVTQSVTPPLTPMPQETCAPVENVTGDTTETDTDTETDKEQKQILPGKKKALPDDRFTEFKKAFDVYFFHRNQKPAPWDGREAGTLARWLKANPTYNSEEWMRLLNNRAKSPVVHAKRLSAWIEYAAAWLHEPGADDWGKPTTKGAKPNGNNNSHRHERSAEALRTALQQRAGNHGRTDQHGLPAERGSVPRLPDELRGKVIEGER